MVKLKRAYEAADKGDGYRILVDRLWPRGISKRRLMIESWDRDLAPSHTLRRWFGHDPKRWPEFVRRYRQEMKKTPAAEHLRELARRAVKGTVTLVYSARDVEHNDAVVLRNEIEALGKVHSKIAKVE